MPLHKLLVSSCGDHKRLVEPTEGDDSCLRIAVDLASSEVDDCRCLTNVEGYEVPRVEVYDSGVPVLAGREGGAEGGLPKVLDARYLIEREEKTLVGGGGGVLRRAVLFWAWRLVHGVLSLEI